MRCLLHERWDFSGDVDDIRRFFLSDYGHRDVVMDSLSWIAGRIISRFMWFLCTVAAIRMGQRRIRRNIIILWYIKNLVLLDVA